LEEFLKHLRLPVAEMPEDMIRCAGAEFGPPNAQTHPGEIASTKGLDQGS